MQKVMQTKAAVFRSGATLDEGIKAMAEVRKTFADVNVADKSLIWNTDLVETLELDNLLSQATVTINAAGNRTRAVEAMPVKISQTRRRKLDEAYLDLAD